MNEKKKTFATKLQRNRYPFSPTWHKSLCIEDNVSMYNQYNKNEIALVIPVLTLSQQQEQGGQRQCSMLC
jgi:hypothetical protein